jgi:hypothetical protein
MSARFEITTAILAAFFGGALLATNGSGEGKTALHPKTTRELVIISRVLEKRLGEMRKSLVASLPPAASIGASGGTIISQDLGPT